MRLVLTLIFACLMPLASWAGCFKDYHEFRRHKFSEVSRELSVMLGTSVSVEYDSFGIPKYKLGTAPRVALMDSELLGVYMLAKKMQENGYSKAMIANHLRIQKQVRRHVDTRRGFDNLTSILQLPDNEKLTLVRDNQDVSLVYEKGPEKRLAITYKEKDERNWEEIQSRQRNKVCYWWNQGVDEPFLFGPEKSGR
ncbi:MAG: hypothetical protein AAF203_05755 [Pseudomonadota bacterium]